ncbi:hypothetical protein GUJ93_ZPchr0008g13402 [Zizania palustris]|uniref:Uncharacterized protein n=1 Tax=Zizania palustris TaxID=103762 RepID=A0A8J5RTQ7_ZIZPA|nr:hypothetical protein GUJ93_ZPchr0008g13402 [Zizania palustris]
MVETECGNDTSGGRRGNRRKKQGRNIGGKECGRKEGNCKEKGKKSESRVRNVQLLLEALDDRWGPRWDWEETVRVAFGLGRTWGLDFAGHPATWASCGALPVSAPPVRRGTHTT